MLNHIIYYIYILHYIISYPILSYRIVSYRIISYHIISYHIMSCHVMSCHVISCIMIYHVILHYILLYDITLFYIISYHIMSYCIALFIFIISYSCYIISLYAVIFDFILLVNSQYSTSTTKIKKHEKNPTCRAVLAGKVGTVHLLEPQKPSASTRRRLRPTGPAVRCTWKHPNPGHSPRSLEKSFDSPRKLRWSCLIGGFLNCLKNMSHRFLNHPR